MTDDGKKTEATTVDTFVKLCQKKNKRETITTFFLLRVKDISDWSTDITPYTSLIDVGLKTYYTNDSIPYTVYNGPSGKLSETPDFIGNKGLYEGTGRSY